jgi:hypothetical protein
MTNEQLVLQPKRKNELICSSQKNRSVFDDFRNVIFAASEHLKDLQRTGQNVAFFQSLVVMLPDPNDPTGWKPAVLDIVRNHLCEQNEQGTYRYAMIPIVAVGVAVQYSKTRKQFDSVAGLYKNGYRSKIRDDLFYWNHFNTNRQSLTKYTFSLRWLWHILRSENPAALETRRA